MTVRRSAWVALGSLVVCAGLALVGVAAFAGRLWRVVVGFVLFVVGYRTMQYGVHGWPSLRRLPRSRASLADHLTTAAGLGASVILAAYGFVLMGRAVETGGAAPMLLSGVAVVAGYVVGHRVANDEVL